MNAHRCTNCGEDEEVLHVIGPDKLCMGCIVGEIMRLRARRAAAREFIERHSEFATKALKMIAAEDATEDAAEDARRGAAMKTFDVDEAQAAASSARERMRFQIYRHYKGGTYRVLDVVCDEATGAPFVIYRSEDDGHYWMRPLANFEEKIESTERLERFQRVQPPVDPLLARRAKWRCNAAVSSAGILEHLCSRQDGHDGVHICIGCSQEFTPSVR